MHGLQLLVQRLARDRDPPHNARHVGLLDLQTRPALAGENARRQEENVRNSLLIANSVQ